MLIVAVMLLAANYLHKSDHMMAYDKNGKLDIINMSVKIILFGMIGIMADHFFSYDINGVHINTIIFIAAMAGVAGGPFVGISVGIIIGLEGFLSGLDTELACIISPVIAGFLGGFARWMAGMRYPRVRWVILAALLGEIIHVILLEFTFKGYTNFTTEDALTFICLTTVSAILYSSIYLTVIRHKPLEF